MLFKRDGQCAETLLLQFERKGYAEQIEHTLAINSDNIANNNNVILTIIYEQLINTEHTLLCKMSLW